MPKPLPPQPLDPAIARQRAARLARDASRPGTSPRNAHYRVLDLEDEIPFGKYRGRTIEDLIDSETRYVTWLLESTDIELSAAAEAEYHKITSV